MDEKMCDVHLGFGACESVCRQRSYNGEGFKVEMLVVTNLVAKALPTLVYQF